MRTFINKNIISIILLTFLTVLGFFFVNQTNKQNLVLNTRADDRCLKPGLDCDKRLEGQNVIDCSKPDNSAWKCCDTSEYRKILTNGKYTCVKQNLTSYNCGRYGYYDIEPSSFAIGQAGINIANDFKNNYCKDKNKNNLFSFGGGWGINAKCYSKTKLCSSLQGCISPDQCFTCLNERTDINSCIVNGLAPTNVFTTEIKCPTDGVQKYGWGQGNNCYSLNGGIKYRSSGEPYCVNTIVEDKLCCRSGSTNPKCPQPSIVIATAQPTQVSCSGQTCNGTAIGSCPQGYLRRCRCVNNLARFVDDKSCGSSITPAEPKCYYGGNSITEISKDWYDKNYHFCIRDSLGYLVGARCQSNSGVLINGNAKDDTNTCPKPTIGACKLNENKWQSDKTTCEYGKNKYLPYGQCLPGNYKCKCDDNAKYNYPTLQIDTSCGT